MGDQDPQEGRGTASQRRPRKDDNAKARQGAARPTRGECGGSSGGTVEAGPLCVASE